MASYAAAGVNDFIQGGGVGRRAAHGLHPAVVAASGTGANARRWPLRGATTASYAALRAPPRGGLLPAVASHAIASTDPRVAKELSDLLRVAVTPGTSATYDCGFRSLVKFCEARSLPSLPVDSVTLCAWMSLIGQLSTGRSSRVKPKSIMKYISGVRHAHLMAGVGWPLSKDPLVLSTLRALRRKFPESDKLQKAPMSLSILLKVCRSLPGWPALSSLCFEDLLWACASCVAFFAALRGGEFFTRPGGKRPILLRSMIFPSPVNQHCKLVRIEVPAPKTAVGALSQTAIASSPGRCFELDPWVLWTEYDGRRLQLLRPASDACPAFQRRSGKALDSGFMLGRTNDLCERCGIVVLDSDGSRVPTRSASWRAGFVLSAREARVPEPTINAAGRWKSAGGSWPYSFDSASSLGEAALQRLHFKACRLRLSQAEDS